MSILRIIAPPLDDYVNGQIEQWENAQTKAEQAQFVTRHLRNITFLVVVILVIVGVTLAITASEYQINYLTERYLFRESLFYAAKIVGISAGAAGGLATLLLFTQYVISCIQRAQQQNKEDNQDRSHFDNML